MYPTQDLAPVFPILAEAGAITTTGVFALDRLGELAGDPPDAIVVAVCFDPSQRVTVVRGLHRDFPHALILVIGRDSTSAAARDVLIAGAHAFVLEQDAARALGPALRAVRAGLVCAPQSAMRGIARPSFTSREKDVLALVVTGMTNQQIAARLWLAESTVKTHVASAFAKLGVRSRKDAAAVVLDPAEGLRAIALPPELTAHPSDAPLVG